MYLVPVCLISGRVSDWKDVSMKNVTVSFNNAYIAVTDEEGVYSLRVPRCCDNSTNPIGTLSVMAPGYIHNTLNVDVSKASVVADVCLSPYITVRGTVSDNMKNAISGAVVEIDGKTDTTDEYGSYEIAGLAPKDRYTITVSAQGYSDFVGAVEVDDISVRKDITLFSSGAIIITVTDATTGLPLSDAGVILDWPTTGTTCVSFVSENGQYIFFAHEWGLEFPDVETEVFVTASMDGYGAQQVDFIWHPGKAEPLDFALYTAINAINTPEELASAEAGTCAVTGDNWDGALALNGTDDFEDGSVYVKIDGLHGYRILLPANGATEINAGDKI
ncbi:MAG: carboxypeptidase regulatory-like domain-containing protein, partial [Abditibacteriota bacterium]|nr:carboxypeptidase regulatory-like domain-containing protein [Abditibacteriota bacterium]